MLPRICGAANENISVDAKYIDKLNQRMRRYEEIIYQEMKIFATIDVDESLLVSDVDHVWGYSPYHYISEYYQEAKNQLFKICQIDSKVDLNENEYVIQNSFDKEIIYSNLLTKNDNIFQLPLVKNKFDTNDISLLMKKLGKRIIFIEGGGATVSNLYNRNNLDRIHLCISPIILGKGRSSFIMQENTSLNDVINHNIEYYQMGKDILCDIKLS